MYNKVQDSGKKEAANVQNCSARKGIVNIVLWFLNKTA